MLKALLYFNPTAGRQAISGPRLSKIRELLYAQGIHCSAVPSLPRSEGLPRLDLKDHDLVIAMGGDGTIHDLLPVAVQTDTTLGILPSGTANVLAAELGIPSQIDRAIRLLRAGPRKRISLGQADGEFFHLMAGIGVDGCVIRRTSPRLKKLFGPGAYWLAGLRTYLELRLDPFRLEIDGDSQDATFAVISNCKLYGGQLKITPQASPFTDHLDICLFRGRRRSNYIRYLLGIATGRHTGFPDVRCLTARKIRLEASTEVPVQLDGDVIEPRPALFEIKPKALEVVTG